MWKEQTDLKSPVEKELEKEILGNHLANKVFLEMVKLLQEFGSDLKMPHTKYLGEDVYELRDKPNGKRYYYAFTKYVMKEREQKK